MQLSYEQMFSQWAESAFGDPAPDKLLQAVRDHVRRAFASHLALGTIEQQAEPQELEKDVMGALGKGLDVEATEALLRLVRRAVQEITVDSEPQELTRLLWMWKAPECSQDTTAIEERLFTVMQMELCKIAARKLWGVERLKHRVTPGDLLDDLYIHLHKANIPHLWENRRQFYAMAAKALDNIIRDMLKERKRKKHFKTDARVTMSTLNQPAKSDPSFDSVEFWELLDRLRDISPRQADAFHMHIIEERPIKEVAATLGIAEATVKRDVAFAKESLRQLLGGKP